ncbi:MAG: hypothetical protein IJ418_15505 [Clostridia bacterium]|nr:hypothetical protein [Clostridia bacterium]
MAGMPILTLAQRNDRLKNEYDAMIKFPVTDLFRIALSPGQKPPYVTSYTVTYYNKTLVKFSSGGVKPQMKTVVRIDLPEDFPVAPPMATVIEGSYPHHPNWYISGRMCPGTIWEVGGWVWDFVVKIGRVLAFDPIVTTPSPPANREAAEYWKENYRKFPCGRIDFPHPRGY